MARAPLTLWMNGLLVGTWSEIRGTPTLTYAPSWVTAPEGRALSLSLPFTPDNAPHRGPVVAHYFDNLLPDSDAIRARLRDKFSTGTTGAFDLLTAVGRDCVGALQLLPEGIAPEGFDRIEAKPLSENQVEAILAQTLSGARILGLKSDPEFRLSLAGAQEKTAFLFHEGKWCRPLGATPTTHIFKLPLGLVGHLQVDLKDSLENEWLCLQLLSAYGLATPPAKLLQFGDRKVLSVERFDRSLQPKAWIARLPQEDFCQALGLSSDKKYEADGGPGMLDLLRLLDLSSRAEADKRAFLKAQILFWLLAATDGHAKNFSLAHERGGSFRLTPFYDVLSAWPLIGRGSNQLPWKKTKLAMAVRSKNAHWNLSEIKPRHWDSLARRAGLESATPLLSEIAQQTPAALSRVTQRIPKGFPARIQDSILNGLIRSISTLS